MYTHTRTEEEQFRINTRAFLSGISLSSHPTPVPFTQKNKIPSKPPTLPKDFEINWQCTTSKPEKKDRITNELKRIGGGEKNLNLFRTLLFEEEMGVDGWSEKIWFYVFLSELVEKRKKKKWK